MYKRNANKTASYTQELVETALLILMEKKDYSKINVSELCEKAGIARNTFYRNFETKEDVLDSIIDKFRKEIMTDYGENESAATHEKVFSDYLCFFEKHKNFIYTLQKNGLMYKLEKWLVEGTSNFYKIYRKEMAYTDYVTSFIANTYYHVLETWVSHGFKEPVDFVYNVGISLISSSAAMEKMTQKR